MTSTDRIDPDGAGIPEYLRDAMPIAVVRLALDGSMTQADTGFLRAAGGPDRESIAGAWNVASAYLRPSFSDLAGCLDAPDGVPIFRETFETTRRTPQPVRPGWPLPILQIGRPITSSRPST